jgi:hypothetical protein
MPPLASHLLFADPPQAIHSTSGEAQMACGWAVGAGSTDLAGFARVIS